MSMKARRWPRAGLRLRDRPWRRQLHRLREKHCGHGQNPGDYWDYISGGSGKGQPLVNGALPIVAIATTAGTGTEADPWTVITKEDTNEKIGFGCSETFPVLSVVDPEMMLTIPAHLTAYQGFDALFHATEGYIANVATPLSDAYALKSIELLAKYLPAAVKDGSDLEARTQVALASTLSGMVESTSCCTSEHGMEHALSAFYPKLPHGAGLIMLSEAYYSFFADKAPERFTAMAKAMGVVTAPAGGERPRRSTSACGIAEGVRRRRRRCPTTALRRKTWPSARPTRGIRWAGCSSLIPTRCRSTKPRRS